MNSYEVVGVAHDGEIVCPDCYTEDEEAAAIDDGTSDEISPIFAQDAGETDICSRCGEKLT